ncbi:selenium metabolism-associated LysR family transcriptional regulator [Siminovitchia sediminis]|uniref:Selenium metabolism-associated LysR family transcriptional regulator n=1 Tax=Siminovitchia sediminis TaxID=1274353 RepID=A0ABW4KHN0_9BACI
MNFNHLKAFVTVVELGNYKEAAKRLAVSQPAVTQRIQLLDEHFKTKLLQRDAGGVHLTSQGKIVYEYTLSILKKWENLESQLLGAHLTGKLTVGASTIPSEYLLPKYIKGFMEEYKEVEVHIQIAGSKEVFQWLLNGTVDVIVTGKPENHPRLITEPVLEEELKIVVPLHDGRFSKTAKLAELTECDWVIRELNSGTRLAWEQELRKNGIDPKSLKVAGQMGSTEAIIAAVEAGIGISVISSLAAEQAVRYGRVKALQLDDFIVRRNFHISTLKDYKNNPLVTKFISFLTTEMKNYSLPD